MPRPSWYLQETLRQSVRGEKTVWAPARDSHTLPDNIPDRRVTSRRLPDSLRWCQDRQGTRLPESLRRCKDRLGTCRRFPNSLRRSERLSGTDIYCLRVSCRCTSSLRDCLITLQTVGGSAAGAPPVSETVWHSHMLSESLLLVLRRYWHHCRPSLSILLVPRRSWHRRRLSGSLLQMSRRSWHHLRLSGSLLLVP
ncbi:hypothetical protein DPMN_181612 [Dreissena polymorpha]|uniref:Uncharacterized protein n=1 Tax=Dreissena polymorpha TaxID=45954 RepID=A0A9D4I1T8_DREPO|nr:hypothetical protein DPMN_181612 [Dreissena polymorpha]